MSIPSKEKNKVPMRDSIGIPKKSQKVPDLRQIKYIPTFKKIFTIAIREKSTICLFYFFFQYSYKYLRNLCLKKVYETFSLGHDFPQIETYYMKN